MKVIGKTMICMVKVCTNGLTDGNIKVILKMIRNMVMENILTLMVDAIKVCGKKASKMVKEHLYHLKAKRGMENGKKVKGLAGWMDMNQLIQMELLVSDHP